MDYAMVSDFIKNYGFPIAVAIWALWRLDKSYSGNGGNIDARLIIIEDALDRVEVVLQRNTDIQTELVTTMKIIQTIMVGR